MAVYESLSMGLDFSPGFSFKAEIKRRFRTTVHPIGKANHFLLAVSFGRSNFRLNVDSVSMALESCIGGLCDDLSVLQLQDEVFRFSVSLKIFGFMVYSLRSYVCDQFKCFFHLWGIGGPNWRKEFMVWKSECDQE
uniref:Uncharacterized protein n=1 Tax=Avena sativa TaxID=4498 RepID=A0ACD5VRG0_AVESA